MKKYGFTLIELMVVIAIIGILAIIVLPNFIGTYNNAVEKAMITQENEIVDAARLFIEDFCRNPLNEYKGQCNNYSIQVNNSNPTLRYTCLNSLQTHKYIDEVVTSGVSCRGFVTYDKETNSRKYSNYKAYLDCGDAYQTPGLKTIKDSSNAFIVNKCGTVVNIN